MTLLKLGDGFELAVEHSGKHVRLVIYKNGAENVCRKDTVSNLVHFIKSDAEQAYRGRLQLHKTPNGIEIEVKGQAAGIIKEADFLDFVNAK